MKSWIKVVLIILGIILALIIIGFSTGYLEAFYTKTVGKTQQNAEYAKYKESQPYVEGMIQDLVRYKHEWIKSSDNDKVIIETEIRERFANFSEDNLSDKPDLQLFFHQIMNK